MGSRARSLGVSDCFPSVLVQHLCSQDPRHLARPVHDPRGLSAPRGDWLPEGCSEQHAGRSESGETSLPWAEVGKARQLAGWGPGRRLRGCEGYSGRRAGSRPCSWRPHRVEACCWRFRSPRLCPVLAGSSFPLLCSLLGHGLSGLGQEMVPGLRRKRGSQGSAGMVWGTPPPGRCPQRWQVMPGGARCRCLLSGWMHSGIDCFLVLRGSRRFLSASRWCTKGRAPLT